MSDVPHVPLPRKWWILGLGLPPLVWLDLYTKHLVATGLHPYRRVPVIEGFFDLFYTKNRGAAFGLFGDLAPEHSTVFFIAVSILALAILGYLFRGIRTYATFLGITVTLILAGAVGNFVDRVRMGYVIDFLDVYVGQAHWPTFNVADICISVGAGLLIVYSVFLEPRERRAARAQSEGSVAGAS